MVLYSLWSSGIGFCHSASCPETYRCGRGAFARLFSWLCNVPLRPLPQCAQLFPSCGISWFPVFAVVTGSAHSRRVCVCVPRASTAAAPAGAHHHMMRDARARGRWPECMGRSTGVGWPWLSSGSRTSPRGLSPSSGPAWLLGSGGRFPWQLGATVSDAAARVGAPCRPFRCTQKPSRARARGADGKMLSGRPCPHPPRLLACPLGRVELEPSRLLGLRAMPGPRLPLVPPPPL